MIDDYKELKELCKKEGCYCPPEHVMRLKIANTSLWLRLYFRNKQRGGNKQ